MASISNDRELREALNELSAPLQRIIGARFTQNVLGLSMDDRISRAVATALNPDASDAEVQDAYAAAKGYAAKTYTACGRDTDWLAQADHFVAASVVAALTPSERLAEKVTPAWKAAVQARMARNCAMMVEDEGEEDTEAERQYRIVADII